MGCESPRCDLRRLATSKSARHAASTWHLRTALIYCAGRWSPGSRPLSKSGSDELRAPNLRFQTHHGNRRPHEPAPFRRRSPQLKIATSAEISVRSAPRAARLDQLGQSNHANPMIPVIEPQFSRPPSRYPCRLQRIGKRDGQSLICDLTCQALPKQALAWSFDTATIDICPNVPAVPRYRAILLIA